MGDAAGPIAPFPLRTDACQTGKGVVAVIYLRGVRKTLSDWKYDADARILKVSVKVDGEEHSRVWGWVDEVLPDTLKVTESEVKIEISLQKKRAAMWAKAEVTEKELGPLYQQWAGFKQKEEEEIPEGGDGGLRFLRKMYADMDDDVKRAMIKSMQESGGTVMNGNWDQVKDKKIKPYKSKEEKRRDGDSDAEDD